MYVADSSLAAGLSGSVELSVSPPDVGFQPWGSVYRVDATIQPIAPVAVRIPSPGPLPAETAVIVMVSDTPNGPWEPLETRQELVDGTIEAITPHFSWFTAIVAPFIDLVGEARRVFEDATAGFTAEAEQPTCAGETEARQTVQIASASSDAVKWCLGVENGTTILRVTNNRRYALQAAHPGLTVIDAGVDPASITQLTNGMDPRFVLLSPRRPVTMSVDSPAASLNIEFNGLADSLYQLQVGVETALTLLSKFGVSGDWYQAAATLVQSAKCAATMFDPTGGSIIANCFDAQSILDAFGPRAVVVAMLMTVAPLLDFFRSRFNAAADILQHRDEYWVTISPLAQPTTTPAPVPTANPDVLAEGATGDSVLALQRELRDRGYPIDVDGIFGPGTTSAVRQVQDLLLLDVDGLVGPETSAMLGLGGESAAAAGVTADQLADAIIAYLNDLEISVPSDVVAALGVYRDFDPANVEWTVGEPAAGVNGRTIYGFVFSGDGGVYIYGDLCIRPQTKSTPAAFCGIWYISFHG